MLPDQVKSFTLHTRRLLYFNRLADFTIQSLQELPLPSLVKVDIKNMVNSHNRFLDDIKCKITKNSLEILKYDLALDKIHNLNIIMDLLSHDEDTDDVVEWLLERNKGRGPHE